MKMELISSTLGELNIDGLYGIRFWGARDNN